MTLFEHLRELRYRLVVASIAILLAMIVCAVFNDFLFDLLRRPYDLGIAELKRANPDADTTLVNTNLTSPFVLLLKICLVGGLVISGPIWLWQLWAFIMPGLLSTEKKWALIFIAIASPLFAAGVVTAYLVMPKGIGVLLGFTQEGVSNLQDINNYLSFLLRLMVVFGIAYLIPLLVLMLNIVGVVSARSLSKYRVYVIFFTFVFGAVATPSTDPFAMVALAIPMTLLFLAAEVIAHILDRRKARRVAEAGGDEVAASSIGRDKALRELDEHDDTLTRDDEAQEEAGDLDLDPDPDPDPDPAEPDPSEPPDETSHPNGVAHPSVNGHRRDPDLDPLDKPLDSERDRL